MIWPPDTTTRVSGSTGAWKSRCSRRGIAPHPRSPSSSIAWRPTESRGPHPTGEHHDRSARVTTSVAPLVSILVVTYRKHELFGRCFASLVAGTDGLDVEYVVVVNGPRREPEHEAA